MLEYPDALRRSMVEAHLKFTPSWIYDGMGRDRGDLVVFYEYVLATMRNVVGVLAGLNRVYVAPDKLKRVGAVVSRMELTPPDAAATARRLLDLPRERVKPELDDLVAATLDLVEQHLPESTRRAPARSGRSGPSRATVGPVDISFQAARVSILAVTSRRTRPLRPSLSWRPPYVFFLVGSEIFFSCSTSGVYVVNPAEPPQTAWVQADGFVCRDRQGGQPEGAIGIRRTRTGTT